jgi:hypothetical protein
MITSSSDSLKDQALFIVQSGIAAWEDLQRIVDWRWKTVSVFSGTLTAGIPLLWAMVAARPSRLNRILRISLAPAVSSMTESQKRRMFTKLKKDPPGFSGTTLSSVDTHVCVTSTLSDPTVVDPEFLTFYRRCALVAVEDPAAERLPSVCATLTDLGGSGISTLLNGAGSPAVLRVAELETHSVIQLIGASDVSNLMVRCLSERHIRQFNDIRTLPREIAGLRR